MKTVLKEYEYVGNGKVQKMRGRDGMQVAPSSS